MVGRSFFVLSFSSSPVRRGGRCWQAARRAASSAATSIFERARVTPVYSSSGPASSCAWGGSTSSTDSNSLPCERCTALVHNPSAATRQL